MDLSTLFSFHFQNFHPTRSTVYFVLDDSS